MLSGDVVNWSEFECRISDILAEREAAQIEIDENIRRNDLFGASMGSFKHALASLELGDRADFYCHVMLAMALAEADIVFEAEAARPDPLDIETSLQPEPVKFKTPDFLHKEPGHSWILDHPIDGIAQRRPNKDEEYYEKLRLNHAILQAVDKAESVLAVDTVFDESEQNAALLEAIITATDFIDSKAASKEYDAYDEKFKTLKLASHLAARLHINVDPESTYIAFKAYERLTLTALRIEGKTLSVHNQSLQAFKEIFKDVGSEDLVEQCQKYISTLNRVRAEIIARAMILPAIWIKNDYYFTGAAGPTKGARTRPSLAMQRRALEAYEEILEQHNQPSLCDVEQAC